MRDPSAVTCLPLHLIHPGYSQELQHAQSTCIFSLLYQNIYFWSALLSLKMLAPIKALGAEVGTDRVIPGPSMRQYFHLLLQIPLWPWSETANIAVSKRSFHSIQFTFSPWPIQQGNILIMVLWISGLRDCNLIKTGIQSCLETSSRRNMFSFNPCHQKEYIM